MRHRFAAVLLAVVCGVPLVAQSEVADLEQALRTAGEAERVELLNKLARAIQGNAPRDSIPHATEALELAERLNDTEGRVESLNNLGIAHYYLAEYDAALGYYKRSLALAEESGNDEQTANALNNIGIIHFVWGEYEQTLECYSRTLRIRKRIGDERGQASAYNNLGNVYYATESYQESLEYYAEALALYEEFDDEGRAASTRNNIGLSYFKLDRLDEALAEFERALEIEERIGNKPDLARSLNHIGMVYDSHGRYLESLANYRRSLAVREEIGDRQGVAISHLNIGATFTKLDDPEASMDHLGIALEVAEEINLREVERDIHQALSAAFERTGDFEQALESHRRYKEIYDDLFDEETGRRLAELQARYELEKKDREIEVLRKDQQIQRTVRNAGLAGSVLLLLLLLLLYNHYRLKARAQGEREQAARAELAHVSRVATLGELTSALAHELRQPLTAILTNAQAARRLLASDHARREEVDEALGDIAAEATRSSDIVQKLRDLLRRGETTQETLDINETLRRAEPFAQADARQHGAVLVMNLGAGLPAVSGDPIQLQQVLLNLVHNAAEAMSQGTDVPREIVVTTSMPDDDTILVAVRDAGPSLDDAVAESMFNPFFTTKPDGLGMGLPISYTIVEAHGGRLWATPNTDRGLTVQFTLPRFA